MKSATDIVFVFPPAYGNVGAFKNHLGVSYFRAVLNKAGLHTEQYLNDRSGTIDAVAADILSRKPHIVGLTAYDANLMACLALARSLKRRQPEIPLLMGGPTATFGAKEMLARHEVIDFCVRGETEEFGLPIMEALLGGGRIDYSRLPGIAFRQGGQVVCTEPPPLVGCCAGAEHGLDSVPSPYLTGVLTDGKTGVLSGRGCTYHCQYCCFAALGQKRLRLHSVERVVAELACIADHQKRTGQKYVVSIHDDAFTLSPERAKKLCQTIIAKEFGLLLSCITRADKVDEELLTLMKAAGFVGLAYGLESAVPSVLRATGKVRPPQWPDPDLGPEREFVRKIRSSVKSAKKLGYNVGVSIILGLPSEQEKDGLATIRFVRKLPIDYYMHNFLWVFPGTPLWNTHRQYGLETTINALGLPMTIRYAYDLSKVRPATRCSLERDARMIRLMTADGLFGCSAFDPPAPGIAVAVLHADLLTPQVAEWLAHSLNIGGLLIQVYSRQRRSQEDVRLYQDRATFGERLVLAQHHVQALDRSRKDGEVCWMLACSGVDLYRSHKPELLRLRAANDAGPFVDWSTGAGTACDFCDVTDCARSPEMLDGFFKGLNGDGLFSRLTHMGIPPRVQYPGRWQTDRAPCAGLSRIEITADDKVKCCRHGQSIGKVGDSVATLRSNLAALLTEAEQRRGCAACAQANCPRCPFPGMDDAAYCAAMRRAPQVRELLNLAPTFSRFPLILESQRDKVGND